MRPIKGSAEAKAWAKRMLLHRMKKASIRTAGKMAEKQFFGPKGIFAKAGHMGHLKSYKNNPHLRFKQWVEKVYGMKWSFYIDLPAKQREIVQANYYAWEKKYFKKNPGQAWHEGMEHVAARHGRQAQTKEEKILFKGVEVAHKDSKLAARRMRMNSVSRPVRKNPLAVFTLGNPPERINTCVAGIIYNRCLEIRAEKTGYQKGLYRHPFNRKSGVQILALDNGDLLIHSTAKVRLWKRS